MIKEYAGMSSDSAPHPEDKQNFFTLAATPPTHYLSSSKEGWLVELLIKRSALNNLAISKVRRINSLTAEKDEIYDEFFFS